MTARYRLATDVPQHWILLAAEQLADQASIRMRLVPLARADGRWAACSCRATATGCGCTRRSCRASGFVALRTCQRVRRHGGQTVTWTGRNVEPDRGQHPAACV